MTAATYDFTMPRGAEYAIHLTYRGPSPDGGTTPGDLIDLTGCAAHMQLRLKSDAAPADEPLIDLSVGEGITLGGAAGTIDILLTGPQTDLATGKCVYDLFVWPTTHPELPDKLLKGTITPEARTTNPVVPA